MTVARYLKWRGGDAVGCVYARMMTRQPTSGQIHIEIKGDKASMLAATIAKHVDTYVLATDSNVLTCVLSGVTSLQRVVEISQVLGSLPKWTLALKALPKTDRHGPHVGFVINRMIPFGKSELPSEALFLGPFDEFPNTRRAPVVAFEVFVGDPLPCDPKTDEPSTKANLAHAVIPAARPGTPIFKHMWKGSKKGRRKSLKIPIPVEKADEVPANNDDLRAKAKVAFAIPVAMAKKLGIKP